MKNSRAAGNSDDSGALIGKLGKLLSEEVHLTWTKVGQKTEASPLAFIEINGAISKVVLIKDRKFD